MCVREGSAATLVACPHGRGFSLQLSRKGRAITVSSATATAARDSSATIGVPLDSVRLLQVRCLQAAWLWLAAGGLLGAVTALGESRIFTAGLGVAIVCCAALALRHDGPMHTLLHHRPTSLALIATHSLLGFFAPGYATTYVAVLVGLVVVNTLVQGPKLAFSGFVLAAGGFVLGVALRHASGPTQSGDADMAALCVGTIPVIATGYVPLTLLFSVFRHWTGPGIAGISDVRDGVASSLSPVLTRAMRGEYSMPALNSPGPALRVATLGARERDVLDLLAQGLTPQQAAGALHLSLAGVRSRIAVAKRTLGARTLEHAIATYVQGLD